MKFSTTILFLALFSIFTVARAQDHNKSSVTDSLLYPGNEVGYEVPYFTEPTRHSRPKNVIFMIGDGMGVSQIFSALVANRGNLFLKNFVNIGFITTHSHDRFVTDSGAAGTALACGVKTYKYAIGVDKDTIPVENIREKAEKKGMATGVVSTSTITHATPASFVAHQPNRNLYEKIAADFLKTNIDVFIGGGMNHFTNRGDSTDLTVFLKQKGYTVLSDIGEIENVEKGKLAGFTSAGHNPKILEGRDDVLPKATQTAIRILSQNHKGFFLMVEGSQIDWGGHDNRTAYIVTEVLDFDQAIGKALEFASGNGETLVIVTADHETGGFSVEEGNYQTGKVRGKFTGTDHTGVMVPVFAFGPGSERFRGFHDNTDIPRIIGELIRVEF